MFGFLSRLFPRAPIERIPPDPSLLFLPPVDHPYPDNLPVVYAPNRPFTELGALGTQAFVVTDWQPGPTTWRGVNAGDLPTEPLRRTRTVRGPMSLQGDMGIPLFQGEKTPAPSGGDATDYLEAFALAKREGGYPS